MIANTVTISRVFLTFCVIALLGPHRDLNITPLAIIVLIFALDAIDGYIARQRNEVSKVGAVLDTIADRVIENTFWIYFTTIGLIPLWIPITVMARGFVTDSMQHYITQSRRGWLRALTRSRTSRALYGTIKMLTFLYLAGMSIFGDAVLPHLDMILATITVTFCLIRAFPIFECLEQKTSKTEGGKIRGGHEKRFNSFPQKTEEFTRR